MNPKREHDSSGDNTGDMIAWMIQRRMKDQYGVHVTHTDALYLAEQIRSYLRGKL